MVQLIALGLIGGLVWYAYNALQKHMKNIGEELDRKQKASGSKGNAEKTAGSKRESEVLELGEDGVYRPREDDRQ